IVFHGEAAATSEPVPAAEAEAEPEPEPVTRTAPKPVTSRSAQRTAPQRGAPQRGAAATAPARAGSRHRPQNDERESRHDRMHHGHAPSNTGNKVGLYMIFGTVALALVYLVGVMIMKFLAPGPAQAMESAKAFLKDGNAKGAEEVLAALDGKNI